MASGGISCNADKWFPIFAFVSLRLLFFRNKGRFPCADENVIEWNMAWWNATRRRAISKLRWIVIKSGGAVRAYANHDSRFDITLHITIYIYRRILLGDCLFSFTLWHRTLYQHIEMVPDFVDLLVLVSLSTWGPVCTSGWSLPDCWLIFSMSISNRVLFARSGWILKSIIKVPFKLNHFIFEWSWSVLS